MASRAKKKANLNTQNIQEEQKQPELQVATTKWGKAYTPVVILLLIFIFFMIMLSPTLFAKIKMTLTGSTEDVEEYTFNVSTLDVIFAPIRGCTSGFKFMLEKMGSSFKSQKEYESMLELVTPYLPTGSVEKANDLGVKVLVISYFLFATFIAAVVLNILDFKYKKKGLFATIGASLFFVMTLVEFIFSLALNVNTIFSSSTINAGWGLWLLFFASMGYLAATITTWVSGSKEKRSENV